VERETAVARKWVVHAETVIEQEQDDSRNAEMAGLTTTKPETTFEEMLNTIGDSLSDLASSDNGEDEEDEDDDEEHPARGKLSEDIKPGWVMGTISKTVQHCRERFRQKQMNLDELTQQGWGVTADIFRGRDKKYGTTELNVPAVIQPQNADDAASSVTMTFSERLETLERVPGKLQMWQVTAHTESSHIRLGLGTPQMHKRIPSLLPAPIPDWSQSQLSKLVEPISFDPCISRPKLINI